MLDVLKSVATNNSVSVNTIEKWWRPEKRKKIALCMKDKALIIYLLLQFIYI